MMILQRIFCKNTPVHLARTGLPEAVLFKLFIVKMSFILFMCFISLHTVFIHIFYNSVYSWPLNYWIENFPVSIKI